MSKKTAADLDMTPLAVAERHYAACVAKLDVIWKEIDKMFAKDGDNLRKGVTMVDFDKKLAEQGRAVNELFKATDTMLQHQRGDFPAPTEPAVSEEEVRVIVNASLDDKMDELRFKCNRGLLASHITTAIRMDVSEESFDPPLCKDHR